MGLGVEFNQPFFSVGILEAKVDGLPTVHIGQPNIGYKRPEHCGKFTRKQGPNDIVKFMAPRGLPFDEVLA